MAKNTEGVSIEPIEAVGGPEPQEPLTVLEYGPDRTLREAILNPIGFRSEDE
jgi:hypothetical protein